MSPLQLLSDLPKGTHATVTGLVAGANGLPTDLTKVTVNQAVTAIQTLLRIWLHRGT